MKSVIFALLLLCLNNAYCQELIYKDYNWEESPDVHPGSVDLDKFPAFIVRHSKFLEIHTAQYPAAQYTSEHKIIHVNSDAGIEKFNKVAIPLHGGRELVQIKVRSISRSGVVTNFKKENLKELKNVDGYGNYKIFAVEGLEVGGELEYLYTLKSKPDSYGTEYFQREIPVSLASFEIAYPGPFIFSVKSYNGKMKKESAAENKMHFISLTANNISDLQEEEYSTYKANLLRVEYKLESNGVSPSVLNWEKISDGMLTSLYDPKGYAKIKRFVESIGIDGKSDEEKIRIIEEHVKTNFTIKEGNNEAYDNITDILKTHVANDRGIAKLFLGCWEFLDSPPQLVLASNRYTNTLDPSYANPNNLNEILFYFPTLNKYLSPGDRSLRLGSAAANLASSWAVFVRYSFGKTKHSTIYIRHDFKKIDILDYSLNKLGVTSTVVFENGNMNDPKITDENYSSGYRAFQFRTIYNSIDDNARKDFLKEVTLSGRDDATVISREVEGQELSLSQDPTNAFKIRTTYKAPSLIERAGNSYLVAVGKLIGRQSELYEERERKSDVAFHSPSDYHHRLTIEIPEGYKVSGLDGIQIKNSVKLNSDDVMKFESSYELQDNKLIISINEFYKILNLPKEKFSDFRSVVNSAADFNKVVVVLDQIVAVD